MSFAGVDLDDPGHNSGFDYSDIGASQRSAAAKLTLGQSISDTASGAFLSGVKGIGDYFAMDAESQRARLDAQFNVDPASDPGGALIDPKEWQTKYQDLGLTFTPDMGQAQAQLLVNHRQEEQRRQFQIDNSPNTLFAKSARALTDFAVSAIDPLNVAAAFVPGIGETRAGLWAAKYGKTFARVVEGASAGATGMAALQPVEAAEADAYEDHYGPMDAFLNVAFGTVLGGGLHAGFGKLSDFLGRAAPETRDAALKASVGQMIDGRPVDIEPVLATDPGLAQPPIGTAEPGALETLPVINHEDFALAGREAQLREDLNGFDQQLGTFQDRSDAFGLEYPGSAAKLKDLNAVEDQLRAEDLTPEQRRALSDHRDQILADTAPETLRAANAVTAGRAALETERTGVQRSRDATARMLSDVQAQRRQIAASAALGPYARASIDRARQNSLDFAHGRERSTVAGTPESSAAATEVMRTGLGDDPKAELAEAEARLQGYKAQGILTDQEHAALTEANSAADQASKTRTDAASAAARCLFLHP